MLRQLWNDDSGAIISAELTVIASILVIGLMVGWVVLRNAIFAQLSDQAKWIAGEEQQQTEELIVKDIETADSFFRGE